jgi:hypothetical protein
LSHQHAGDGGSALVMVRAGISTMAQGCRPRGPDRPKGPPPPLPGGVLHPSLTAPARNYLAYRVAAQAASVHTCDQVNPISLFQPIRAPRDGGESHGSGASTARCYVARFCDLHLREYCSRHVSRHADRYPGSVVRTT